MTYKITFSGVATALIIISQMVGKFLPSGLAIWGPFSLNQLLTGSLVNMILIITVLKIGVWPAIFAGTVSSVMAMILQIGPIFPQLVVFIALSNVILVSLTALLLKLLNSIKKPLSYLLATIPASAVKFLFLKTSIPFALTMISGISEIQVKTLSIMFSWPQLITAIVGSVLAITVSRHLTKAI